MPEKDAHIKEVIQKVIGTSRKGREKVIRMVRKQHSEIGSYKIRRVYEQYGFSLSKKLKRRTQYNPANPIEIPIEANREWAMDFMSDALINGRRFRTLNVIDQYNRKCIGIKVGMNFPSRAVINELEKVIERHGKPKAIRTDNGPEFISRLFRKWMHDNDIEHVRIQNGKPQQNAVVERFNKTYREDILNAEIFKSISEAQEITDTWINDYNTNRPHQSLNYQTPLEYAS
jgi:putative transposase